MICVANFQSTLIPQPLLPEREKGSKSRLDQSPSPALGEGFRVRGFRKAAHLELDRAAQISGAFAEAEIFGVVDRAINHGGDSLVQRIFQHRDKIRAGSDAIAL